MKVEWVPLGDVLARHIDAHAVEVGRAYSLVGVKSFARGAFASGSLSGSETKYTALRRVREHQVVYLKLMAWEGAFAVVTGELDGHWVSPEFEVFDVNRELAAPGYVRQFLAWRGFLEAVRKGSSGTNVRRQRLQFNDFLKIRVPLLPRSDQDRVAARLARLESGSGTPHEEGRAVIAERVLEGAVAGAPRVAIGELLVREREWIDIDPEREYRPIGVRGFGRGVIRYPSTRGGELSKLRYYPLRPGRLLVSNIKAWEGAVCSTDGDDAGRIASNRFLQYRSDLPNMVAWLHRYLVSPAGVHLLGEASPGSVDRNRTLSMDSFEAIEVPVPEGAVRAHVARVGAFSDRVASLSARRDALRAAILPAARNEIFDAMR